MTLRRGLVYSGGFIVENHDDDVIPITGDLIAGSGLGGRIFTLGQDNFIQTDLPDNASGLIYTADGKIGLDGVARERGVIAIASGDAAVALAAIALASGIDANIVSATAQASGNASIATSLTGQSRQ